MKKNEELATMTAEKLQAYKEHLTVITNGLIELAKSAGRTKFVKNQLLKECYNLMDEEMHTEDEWNAMGAYVNHGEHAYLFWKGEEVEFRFGRFQVKFEEMTEQSEYDEIHAQYPDTICLFRCGDFYEVYREDAQKVCKVLNITLTHRQYIDGARIPMAGFPFHALDTYLPKLVRAGLRVAICDEMKSGKKGVGETHKKIILTSRRGNPLAQIHKIMFYTIDMEIEIDVRDAFDNLTRNEKQGFINENIDRASDERLVAEIQKRGLKIAKDANYQELVNGACKKFLVGGMAARDFLTDSLGLRHAESIDEIINNLKSVLQ